MSSSIELLERALAEAGLPTDPSQVVGKVFTYTTDTLCLDNRSGWLRRNRKGFTQFSCSCLIAGIVTGVELARSGQLILRSQGAEIDGARVEDFTCNHYGQWHAQLVWSKDHRPQRRGYAVGQFNLCNG